MLRLAGAFLLITGCSGMGFLLRMDMKRRLKQLKELIRILETVKSEVSYGKSSLPEICLSVSGKAGEPYGNFLKSVYEESLANTGASFPELWEKQAKLLSGKLFLSREELKSLTGFAACLGYLDPQMQENAIESRIWEFRKQAEEAEAEIAGKGRVYMSLGVVSGLLLTIILF